MNKGLYIEFEIKRPNRINRYMDYVLMLGLVIVFAVLFIYKPYIDNVDKINEKKVESNTVDSQYQILENSRIESSSSATAYDKNYQISYNQLVSVTNVKYATYFASLLKFTEEFTGGEDIGGFMSISSYSFDDGNKKLIISLSDNSGSNHTTAYINALREDKIDIDGEKHPLYWIKSVEYTYATTSTEVTITYGE